MVIRPYALKVAVIVIAALLLVSALSHDLGSTARAIVAVVALILAAIA